MNPLREVKTNVNQEILDKNKKQLLEGGDFRTNISANYR
jgi:hypothetical protein